MQLQYIGARYVPIWYQNSQDDTANWEINVEYEPLTYVTTENNHLYLSKKAVPDNIGSPADNTEYWLDLGVFITGQYELLQQQIDDMNDGDVPGSLQNQINDHDEIITNLSGRYNISNLSYFKNKKVCIIGDSITANNTNPPNWTVPFTEYITQDGVDAVVNNIASDGASITGYANDVTLIPTDQDIYIIFLGTNDAGGQFPALGEKLSDKIATIMNRIATPNHDIWYISPIHKLGVPDIFDPNHTCPINAYRVYCERVFNAFGARIISGLGAPQLNNNTKSTFMSDGIHPNTAYKDILCNYILDSILSGTNNFSNPLVNQTNATSLLGEATSYINLYWKQDSVELIGGIVNGALTSSWNNLMTVTNLNNAAGLLPTDVKPNVITDISTGKKFFIQYSGGYYQILPFDGAGTYSISFDIELPLVSYNYLP